MIPFNKPPYVGCELSYIKDAINNGRISGDGEFTSKCSLWLENNLNINKCLLTTSCTHALEMAALLLDIKEGDEVIMPSYTFSSTATAFAIRGATIVFVDIRPDTMNIDETLIEGAITKKTKVICVMHYAGVACEMDIITDIAKRHNLIIVEDAAQAVHSTYNKKQLGTIGDLGTFSFHDTKNYSMGEGGALIVNKYQYVEKAEIIREKGTERTKFFRGEIDKYNWVDIGSSYLPSELNAAYLYAQLTHSVEILKNRLDLWNKYNNLLQPLLSFGVELPYIPKKCEHNGHIFYLKTPSKDIRENLIKYLKQNDIHAIFHYIPLHSSKAGKRFGRFYGEDKYTTFKSECLIRLPIYYKLQLKDVKYICERVLDFFARI